MALFEMWWGSTDFPSSEGTTALQGPAGITIQGNVGGGSHKVIAHFFANPQRQLEAKLGNVHVASAPVAVLSGQLDAHNGDTLAMDGDPHTQFFHRLHQAAFIGGRLVAEARSEHLLVDITGDRAHQTVVLGPESFPAIVFSLVPGAELRIDLELEIASHYHKNPRKGCTYRGLLQLPQWGLITGVSG